MGSAYRDRGRPIGSGGAYRFWETFMGLGGGYRGRGSPIGSEGVYRVWEAFIGLGGAYGVGRWL